MNLHDAATAMLSYILQSGLLLAVGLLLPKTLRLIHPRTMLVYWRVLLAVVILLPLAPMDWTHRTPIPAISIEGLHVEAAVSTTLPATLPGLSWRIVFFVVAGVALLGIFRLALGLAYLNRCRQRARPLTPTPESILRLQDRFGLEVPFLVSGRLTAPLTYGWLRPTVLLPPSFRDLSAEQQEGVACHELLHVRRWDWPMTLLEELLRAVLWFHPAVWIILPRIALSREQVVDAATVRLTGKRRHYLDALWRVVCSGQNTVAASAVPFLGRRDLVDRVKWLKREIQMSKSRIALSVLVLAVSIPAVGVFGASLFRTAPHLALSVSGQPAEDESKKKEPEASYPKLKTVSAESLCDEITHPVVVEKINPRYPEDARNEGVTGIVIVETVVTEWGTVDDIRVLKSADDRLAAAATDAIQQWRFEPALCDGAPVSVYYNLTVKFNLEDCPEEAAE